MSKSKFECFFNLQLDDKEVLKFLLSLGVERLDALVHRRLSKGDDLNTAIISMFFKDDGIHFHPGFDAEANINIDLLSIAYCSQILFNSKSMKKKDAEAYIQNFIDTTIGFKINILNSSETRH